MNHEEALRLFASIIDNDLTIGKNHLLDDLPEIFTGPDFLYFFALRDFFWTDIEDENEQLIISAAMTECYLSALLHIASSEYHFDEMVHNLEHCILYGDLLSGAFSEKLISQDKIEMLEEWLEMLQVINKELLEFSLEKKSFKEKKTSLVTHLVESLVQSDETAKIVYHAKQMLIENSIPDMELEDAVLSKQLFVFMTGERWSSSQYLRAFCE